jgi:hypothetical protein
LTSLELRRLGSGSELEPPSPRSLDEKADIHCLPGRNGGLPVLGGESGFVHISMWINLTKLDELRSQHHEHLHFQG